MPSKSAKHRSQALATARRALGKFSDELASPILFSDWPGLVGPMFLEREIAEKRTGKLKSLLAHYRIQPNDKDRWIKLAARLAADLVPGMIAIKVPAKQVPARKNREWTVGQYSELVREIDAIRGVIGPRKVYRATSQLVDEQPKKWGAYGASSLVTRYHEGKKKIEELEKWKASARPLWAPPKT